MLENSSKSILIVDDNVLMLKVLEKAFSNANYKCYMAEGADEALDILVNTKPDIILSDYEMPEKNGFYLRERIIENEATRKIPFVFLTAHQSKHLMLEGLNLKAIDYITKDTPIDVIVFKVNNVLHTVEEQYQTSVDELKIAAEALNFKSVPHKEPVIENWQIGFLHKPYKDFPGGDFIDCITIKKSHTFFIVGDVMGKKWKAWFFAFGILSYIRSAIRICVLDSITSPAAIMQKINHVICQDDTLQDMLCSLSILVLNHADGKITYAGAGDLPIMLFNHQKQALNTIHADGWLLGLSTKAVYKEEEIWLQNNDTLAIFTDGLIDGIVNNIKKSDYDSFKKEWTNWMLQEEEYISIFTQIKKKEAVDDASLLFLKKTS